MKKIILLILLSLMIYSCGEDKKESPKMTDAEVQKAMASMNELTFNSQSEEVALISASHEINRDTISGIIKDYTSATMISTSAKYNSVIDSLSIKYNRNRKQIAQIIFDYKSLQTQGNE